MTIPREEIVREFIESIDGLPRLFTVTEVADVAERLIERALKTDRDPNCEGTSAFAWSNEMTTHLYVIAKLASLLPGPRGREVMFTPEESAVLNQAVAYAKGSEGDTFEEDLIAEMSKPLVERTKDDIDPECSCVCHDISAIWNHWYGNCCDGVGVLRG